MLCACFGFLQVDLGVTPIEEVVKLLDRTALLVGYLPIGEKAAALLWLVHNSAAAKSFAV
jgi:hypothetical protein